MITQKLDTPSKFSHSYILYTKSTLLDEQLPVASPSTQNHHSAATLGQHSKGKIGKRLKSKEAYRKKKKEEEKKDGKSSKDNIARMLVNKFKENVYLLNFRK